MLLSASRIFICSIAMHKIQRQNSKLQLASTKCYPLSLSDSIWIFCKQHFANSLQICKICKIIPVSTDSPFVTLIRPGNKKKVILIVVENRHSKAMRIYL